MMHHPDEQTEIFRRTTAAHSIAQEARQTAWDAKYASYTAMALAAVACLVGIVALFWR